MSLFKLTEWWSFHQGGGLEEFDQGSMCIGNVDNSTRGKSKILTGSFSGMIRIFQPTHGQFSPSHMLLEHQLQEPILQLAIGRFCSGVPLSLAILHQRSLALYQVAQPGEGKTEAAPYVEIHKLQSHVIPHAAANMCYGTFGRSGKDGILVQALDGQIYIFEGGQQVHVTFLEDFLLPGPITYVEETDSFVTCSSAYELHSYTYSSIIQSSQVKSEAAAEDMSQTLSRKKTPSPQWKLLLGELAVDIQLSSANQSSSISSDIIVVGEHTLLICSKDGVLKSQRRLDYHPAAVTSYTYVTP
jgi:Bardet-Biedl syndrome 9 protein